MTSDKDKVFTDFDLERLKINGPEWELPSYEHLAALLHRLERAENCVKMIVDPERNSNPPASYKAWLASKGEGV
jgi:hypothetical protein